MRRKFLFFFGVILYSRIMGLVRVGASQWRRLSPQSHKGTKVEGAKNKLMGFVSIASYLYDFETL